MLPCTVVCPYWIGLAVHCLLVLEGSFDGGWFVYRDVGFVLLLACCSACIHIGFGINV